ncbi:MAG: beta-lactamase family protein [Bacteroidetes bacterium]|nr:beta-lactamase family protein [Bacteroidota bacterium]
MRKIFILMFVCSFGFAQTKSARISAPLKEASPESVGMSTERITRIEQMLQKAITDENIPGATAIICKNGKIIYQKAFGYADVPGKIPMKTDNIFRIASMSKAITSTAVMMLWEQGKLMLDDPISRYIPEFKNPVVLDKFRMADSSYSTVPAAREITVRHLLTHTSGIGYGVIDGDERMKAIYKKAGIVDLFTTENIKIGDNIKKLAKLPLHANPGDKYIYSEGLDVAGYLIEVVSGMPFDQFLAKNIFEPLGMSDTYFYLPNAKADRLVKVHTKTDGKWKHFTDTFYDVDYPAKGAKAFFSGGAGLSSTAKDYATFLQMYLNGGEVNGNRILSRTTVEHIMQNQTGTLFGGEKSARDYGLAFGIINKNGVASAGQGGEGTFDWGGYFNTAYFADPKEKIIGVLMKQTQRIGEDRTSSLFRQMVFASVDD